MWWREADRRWRRFAGPVVVLAAASLTAGCFEPLYGTRPSVSSESVQDKFAAIQIPPITAPQGTPALRIAVGMFNALQFDLHNGAGEGAPGTSAGAPIYRLAVQVSTTQFTAVIDPASGRPDAQVETVGASFELIEIATGKTVVRDSTSAHVDYDVPGPQQRFASQRARRNAEDRAIIVAAEAIRNRLASYFVAGT